MGKRRRKASHHADCEKTSVPIVDFVTLYVTGMVGNNNTVIATVIPPPGGVQHGNHDLDPSRRHGAQGGDVLRQRMSVGGGVAEHVSGVTDNGNEVTLYATHP